MASLLRQWGCFNVIEKIYYLFSHLKALILSEFANAKVCIEKTLGLCSFYAEQGGLMIGFERGLRRP